MTIGCDMSECDCPECKPRAREPMSAARIAELRALLAEYDPHQTLTYFAVVARYDQTRSGLGEALDALEAAEARIRDLKFAMGDEAGWFDRFTKERARAEAAEARAAERAAEGERALQWEAAIAKAAKESQARVCDEVRELRIAAGVIPGDTQAEAIARVEAMAATVRALVADLRVDSGACRICRGGADDHEDSCSYKRALALAKEGCRG